MDEHSLRTTLINPYYAITIHRDFFGKHDAVVSRDKWIKANAHLIEEIGVEAWLEELLLTLEGYYHQY